MLAIIQEIGVIQSVIIALCLGFLLGMLVVIVSEAIEDSKPKPRIGKETNPRATYSHIYSP